MSNFNDDRLIFTRSSQHLKINCMSGYIFCFLAKRVSIRQRTQHKVARWSIRIVLQFLQRSTCRVELDPVFANKIYFFRCNLANYARSGRVGQDIFY